MNVNPMQLIQLIKSGQNPQQLILGLLQQEGNMNPILQNAAGLAQSGNTRELQRIARNLAAQKGLDFDKEFSNFRSSLIR